ncbi:fibrous sheath-interacting protein 2-like [Phasianus colchicus]|uniref:fibrous sheath-interacting protein 2-like n=1 Tax=Phasianus colchicus TaxID=9054 RepID=UPI00129D27B7|nr:fibrous sheath-interacting protein 2-like [Phasianus colchicus]
MERCGTAGFRNPDALLSIVGKSGKLRPGGQEVGAGGSGLLDLPLGVKIPVQPGTKPVFCRTKLGEKLHQPSPHFDLGDPYSRHLSTEYNSLHDPYLQNYHNRKDNLQNLKNRGLVTKAGKVVCTLKEFNEYRQYLTRLKLEQEKIKRQEEENLGQEMPGSKKSACRMPTDMQKSCLRSATTADVVAEEKASPLQPPRTAGPPPRNTRPSGQNRRLKVALVQEDLQRDSKSTGRATKLPVRLPKLETSSKAGELPAKIRSETASRRKPRFHGDREFRAVSEQHREDQSLQEAVKTQATEALDGVKAELGAECSETIELPNSRLSQRQPQPSQVPLSWQSRTAGPGSSEEQSLATSRREKLPLIQPVPSTVDISCLIRRIVQESIENAVSRVKEEEQEESLRRRAKSIVTSAVLRAKNRLEDELHQRP